MASAPQDIADERVVSLNTTTQGKGRLFRVSKIDTKDERKTEVVTEIGNRDGAGFKQTAGGRTASFECYEQKGKPFPDWDALVDSQELVTLTDQIVGGRRFSYGPAKVSNVSRSGDKGGDNMVSVELVATTHKAIK